jgi:prefoldin subunit 5
MSNFKQEINDYHAKHKNPTTREAMLQGKLLSVKQSLKQLVDVGEDYSVFQSAQITHKNLKKALKLLEGLR